jgi:hypothetical protein
MDLTLGVVGRNRCGAGNGVRPETRGGKSRTTLDGELSSPIAVRAEEYPQNCDIMLRARNTVKAWKPDDDLLEAAFTFL